MSKKFEDEFEELVYYLAKIFKQKKVLMPARHSASLLREDRYTLLSKHSKPKFVVVDHRLMDKVRQTMVKMGYIDDTFIIDTPAPEPKKRLTEMPDRIQFHIEDN